VYFYADLDGGPPAPRERIAESLRFVGRNFGFGGQFTGGWAAVLHLGMADHRRIVLRPVAKLA
jgi:hypothetical protein